MLLTFLFACSAGPDEIATAIKSDNPVMREDGAKIAQNYDDQVVVDALVGVLGDTSEQVRLNAIESLAELEAGSAGPALVERLKSDASPKVRRAAADALGRLVVGEAVPDLLAYLAEVVPPGPWLYPEDEVSDVPLRNLAAEITREKLFDRLHQELPYAATVETEKWTDQKDGSVRIEQTIYVERESQKKIVIGKGGETIKGLSMAARAEISSVVEKPVHLFLFVKVRENWGDDPERYREMGIEFPKD